MARDLSGMELDRTIPDDLLIYLRTLFPPSSAGKVSDS